MKRKIETMRILQCPWGISGTHFVTEYPGVESVKRMNNSRDNLEIKFKGKATFTIIDFNELDIQDLFDESKVQFVDLRSVDAIAVRYEGNSKWNRHYLSQITRKRN